MPRLDTLKVLLVDDHDDGREILALYLEYEGASVAQARSGTEALELAGGERPDVVVSNVHMPGLDGLAFLRALRDQPLLAGVPAFALSGDLRLERSGRIADAGYAGFFPKPIDPEIVVRELAHLL
ncbi:response regulator [Sandaracinus amylolyticus]|uniref:response regulator n=1 Tax=Sandaracinus amylolyticus TaxID=927083 RepID=UPI001F15A3AD|nr:response regulator [Sandaracinus amylolyticus]UJR85717.1 Hypothetical protein I5071_77970 [Sandaracinus amylolyticus]